MLVTGGAGFIGSHLVDALIARGDDVTVVDNLSSGHNDVPPRLYKVDVRRSAYVFTHERPQVVYHLAAEADIRKSIVDPLHDADVNMFGTLAILIEAQHHGAKVVFASTGGAIYGECEVPATEHSPRLPLSPYGAAKLAAEEYLFMFNRLYGTQNVALRFANVYGPRQDPTGEAGVVSIFMGCHKRREQATIYGDGLQLRDFVYVGDVVDALLAAVNPSAGNDCVYNVGTGIATSVVSLHEQISRITGAPFAPVFKPARTGELRKGVLNPEYAHYGLGWKPRTALQDGLQATWEWITAAEPSTLSA